MGRQQRIDDEAAWFVFRETLRQLEEDAAGFASMNGLRTRVREFESRWRVDVWRVLEETRRDTDRQRRIVDEARRRGLWGPVA